MKAIITGATGFIGRNLSEHLNEKGINVIASGRSLEVGKELQKLGIEFNLADITDLSQVQNVFQPADYLIHCAAKTADWGSYREFYETNVIGTRNTIQACRTNDIKRIIFVSTPSVYFSGEDRYNISEDETLPQKQFNYGKTKLIAEKELLSLGKDGFKSIILRPRAVYGKYDNTIVPRILQLSKKEKFPLINNGQALVDLTYIGNLLDLIMNCLDARDNEWNEVYNVSNGDPITIKEWFSTVLKIFNRPFHPKSIPEPAAKIIAGIMESISHLPFGNKKPEMTRFSVGYMAKSMTMSIEKAKTKLNYSPQISNEEGFERYAEWYKLLKGTE